MKARARDFKSMAIKPDIIELLKFSYESIVRISLKNRTYPKGTHTAYRISNIHVHVPPSAYRYADCVWLGLTGVACKSTLNPTACCLFPENTPL